jgi:hypothetical protein
MFKYFLRCTPFSAIAAFVINQFFPDPGERVWWFVIFGLIFFGLTWTTKEVEGTIGGLVIGAITGALVSTLVSFADSYLLGATFLGSDLLYFACKWLFPVLFYSGGASLPWAS